jgi:glycerol kinase
LFGVPREALPEICASAGWALPLNNGLALRASLADQSAALAASIVPGEPEALVSLGTGGFVIRYLPGGGVCPEGYLRTLVWQEGDGRAHFACEGTLNSIASALARYPVAECRAEDLARDGVFCLAEPSGLGAPYFRKDLGLTFSAPVDDLPPQRIAALLVEGVVFRVARMLEDMQREFGVGRVYLSGGLSNLPCLQQGIARCAPFAGVHLLPQSEAGLIGAARLAAGMTFSVEYGAVERGAGKMVIIRAPLRLAEKYARWKLWLDGLLSR